jgi:recombination protein RecR
MMAGSDLQILIQLLSKLPGLGARSGRRAALHLIKHRKELMKPLAGAMIAVSESVQACSVCGNLDVGSLCTICKDGQRSLHEICVVEEVADLWALERSSSFKGCYHVLGGTLSALDGIGPDELHIPKLIERVQTKGIKEVILALNLTIEGQTTAHYIADRLSETGVQVTALAHGVPLGGELDYLDDGTLSTALKARRPL